MVTRAVLALLALGSPVILPASAGAQARAPTTPLVRVPFPQDDGTLTPYTFELGYPLVALVYDTLMWRDERGLPQPWLARSVETGSDGRRLTIRLRRGIRWHDGAPLTAEDVAFTFRFVGARPHPRFTPQLSEVERVDAPDRLTVVIGLRRPSPGFADQPLSDVPILPRHLWEELPAGRRAPAGLPVGSGPYRLVGHRRGRGYIFRSSPGYFRGAPRVRTIRVQIIDEAQATIRALEQRKVDMIPVSLPEEARERLEGLSISLAEGPSYQGTVLMLNLRRPPFDRARARQAVASALDLDRIARAVGRAVPSERGYVHPASPWAFPAALHRFDAGAARRDLAGEAVPPLAVLATDNDPVKLEAGRQVVLALQRAGARARLQPQAPEDLSRSVGEDGSAPSFQAAIWSAPALASYDPDFLSRVFGSDPEEAPLNYSGYRSEAFDGLAERVATASDRVVREREVGKELRLLARDLPVIPLFFSEGAFAYRPASFDGWVFIKGSGILDKRSFLRSRQARARSGAGPSNGAEGPAPGSSSFGLLGWLALGLLAVAILLGTAMLLRRRG